MDRARWRGTIMHRLLDRLAVGVEINPAVAEIGPLATLFLRHESGRAPALSLGTSSDRIGSPEGKSSIYATASKSLSRVHLSPYVSLNWSEWDEQFNLPFGASLHGPGNLSLRPLYDGERTHLMASWTWGRYSTTLLWIWMEDFGLAVSAGLGEDP